MRLFMPIVYTSVARSGVRHLTHYAESMSTLKTLKLTDTDALFFSFGNGIAGVVAMFTHGLNVFFFFKDQLPPQTSFLAAIDIFALKLTPFRLYCVGRCFDWLFTKPTL